MIKLLSFLFMLLAAAACHAQDDNAVAAERARIGTEREKAEAAFRADEKACYAKFAVNDCLNAARAHRRTVLADLRRQEIALNDAERKRKAAEHVRALEERSSPEKLREQAQRREESASAQRDREARAARKAADRASSSASAPANADGRQAQASRKLAEASAARSRRDEEAAQNRKSQEQHVKQAQEHKASVEKRLAERTKPPAGPLPVPP